MSNEHNKTTELEKRACNALTRAILELRYYAMRPINDKGKKHLYLVADAAHNIPEALAGNPFFAETFERDVEALETMLRKAGRTNDKRFYDRHQPNNQKRKDSRISLVLLIVLIVIGGWTLVYMNECVKNHVVATVLTVIIGAGILPAIAFNIGIVVGASESLSGRTRAKHQPMSINQ